MVLGCTPKLFGILSPASQTGFQDNNQKHRFSATMRILSLNIWGLPAPFGTAVESRLNLLGGYLKEYDVVLLQEAFHPAADNLGKWSGLPYWFQHDNGDWFHLRSGLMVLSRYPLVRTDFEPFRACENVECLTHKGVFFTRLQHPQLGLIDIYNTHYHSSGGAQDAHKIESIRENSNNRTLMQILARNQQNHPTLIGGDFNMTPNSRPYNTLLNHLPLFDSFLWGQLTAKGLPYQTENLSELKLQEGYTFNSKKNRFAKGEPNRVDYLFVLDSPEVQTEVLESKVEFQEPVNGQHLSDHFGVSARLRFSPLVKP